MIHVAKGHARWQLTRPETDPGRSIPGALVIRSAVEGFTRFTVWTPLPEKTPNPLNSVT